MGKQLVMALGLFVVSALGMGCDAEPEGSCTTYEAGSQQPSEPDSYLGREICKESTASACEQSRGTFKEGDICLPSFDWPT
jgi:hypothetical protein